MVDFLDMQKEFREQEGISEAALSQVQMNLKVLRFDMDLRKENVVSKLDGVIVFPARGYADSVRVGDVWLCSLDRRPTVYYATPLMKITSSVLMGMSEEMRQGITDTLYRLHAKEYMAEFAQKYKDDVYSKATADANRNNQAIIDNLRERISELESQLQKSMFVLNTKNSADDEEIELSSEVPMQAVQTAQAAECQQPVQQVQQEQLPPYMGSQCVCPAPGMPEIRMTDQPFNHPQSVRYRMTRVAAETLFSESLVDGRYFVHINPSWKFIVIKKHDYGNALCIDHRMRLDGLAEYVPFDGRKELMAEYSKRYDGMIVRF